MGIYLWLGHEDGEAVSLDPVGEERVRDRSVPDGYPADGEQTEKGEANPNDLGPEFAEADEEERIEHSHVIRSRSERWEPSLAEMGERFQAGEERAFTLEFFDGESHVIEVKRFTEHRLGGSVLRGEVAGFPGSLVSLATVNGSQAGSIHLPSQGLVYEIRPGPEGTTIFSEIDAAALGECLTCLEPDTFTPPPESFPQPVTPPIR